MANETSDSSRGSAEGTHAGAGAPPPPPGARPLSPEQARQAMGAPGPRATMHDFLSAEGQGNVGEPKGSDGASLFPEDWRRELAQMLEGLKEQSGHGASAAPLTPPPAPSWQAQPPPGPEGGRDQRGQRSPVFDGDSWMRQDPAGGSDNGRGGHGEVRHQGPGGERPDASPPGGSGQGFAPGPGFGAGPGFDHNQGQARFAGPDSERNGSFGRPGQPGQGQQWPGQRNPAQQSFGQANFNQQGQVPGEPQGYAPSGPNGAGGPGGRLPRPETKPTGEQGRFAEPPRLPVPETIPLSQLEKNGGHAPRSAKKSRKGLRDLFKRDNANSNGWGPLPQEQFGQEQFDQPPPGMGQPGMGQPPRSAMPGVPDHWQQGPYPQTQPSAAPGGQQGRGGRPPAPQQDLSLPWDRPGMPSPDPGRSAWGAGRHLPDQQQPPQQQPPGWQQQPQQQPQQQQQPPGWQQQPRFDFDPRQQRAPQQPQQQPQSFAPRPAEQAPRPEVDPRQRPPHPAEATTPSFDAQPMWGASAQAHPATAPQSQASSPAFGEQPHSTPSFTEQPHQVDALQQRPEPGRHERHAQRQPAPFGDDPLGLGADAHRPAPWNRPLSADQPELDQRSVEGNQYRPNPQRSAAPPGEGAPSGRSKEGRPTSEELTAETVLRKRGISRPRQGWRRQLYKATLGYVNMGPSAAELRERDQNSRIRTPLMGSHRLAVISLKGGVGKTTTTAGLGATFASIRGDRIVAIDANPDRGTLGEKVPRESDKTVRDLLRSQASITKYSDVRAFTSQAASRLEVLASDADPAISSAFSEQNYRDAVQILSNFYSLILTDCGTGLLHDAMKGVLAMADSLIIVSSPSLDGARSASATLDWLDAHGYGHLVQRSVAVISAVHNGTAGSPVDVDKVEEHFAARCRAVVRVPWDPQLEAGATVELDDLRRSTREAYRELAALVADDFPAARQWRPSAALRDREG